MKTTEKFLASLSPAERAALLYDWPLRARPEQLVPLDAPNFQGFLFQCGRGWGKTLQGVETVYSLHKRYKGFISHVVAPTAGDVLKVLIFGPSGFLSVRPLELQPKFNKNDAMLTWPNGGRTLLFSAEEPRRLRGPECDFLWFDEFGIYKDPESVFDNAMFGLRRGISKFLITTTPQPTTMMRKLREMSGLFIYQGSSLENRNLSEAYAAVLARYRGTRKERQEVFGEFLEDNPGALDGWTLQNFDALRVQQAPPLRRVFIGIDPAVTSTETSDETGIVAVGQGHDDNAYVLADCSGRHQPQAWARIAVNLYHQLKGDKILAEGNNGGDLVAEMIRNVDSNVPIEIVHATRGKAVRAEPVSLWYHQRRAHHVGCYPELEEEMAAFDPDLWEQGRQASPNRMDALVWAFNKFVGQLSDALGLVDYLKCGAAAQDLIALDEGVAKLAEPASSDHRQCECGSSLIQTIGGGQLRCGQCGRQWWPDGKAPILNLGPTRGEWLRLERGAR